MRYGGCRTVGMSETRISSLLGKITVFVVICFCGLSVQAKYSGGTGEPNDPYQINNVADWQELMSGYTDWDKWFILTADLNLDGVTLTPVGNGSNEFKGIFDGKDHTITNAIIDSTGSYIGLFGKIGNNAYILNVNVVTCYFTADEFHVGGLVGYSVGTSSVFSTASPDVSAVSDGVSSDPSSSSCLASSSFFRLSSALTAS